MSTEHLVKKIPNEFAGDSELTIFEHSGEFDICLDVNLFGDDSLATSVEISDLTLEELKGIRDRISEIISYYE